MANSLRDYVSVVQDLMYIKNTWYHKIDDGELRRGTAILRRLLNEGEYGNLWRFLGFAKEPQVQSVDLDSVLSLFDSNSVVFAFAGGAMVDGVQFTTVVFHEGDECESFNEKIVAESIKLVPVSRYLSTSTAMIEGRKISRQTFIQFIANKSGGVHLKKKNEILNDEFESIKRLEGKFIINFLDAFFREIQCIGQAITDSSDCEKVIKEFNKQISMKS